MCRKDSGSKQKEQSDVEDKLHFARLECFVKSMYYRKIDYVFWEITLDT